MVRTDVYTCVHYYWCKLLGLSLVLFLNIIQIILFFYEPVNLTNYTLNILPLSIKHLSKPLLYAQMSIPLFFPSSSVSLPLSLFLSLPLSVCLSVCLSVSIVKHLSTLPLSFLYFYLPSYSYPPHPCACVCVSVSLPQVLSSAGGVLSMQSLLCAIGIGQSEALPIAATLNWVIKDGLGQLGGVIFASVVRMYMTTDDC